MSIIKSQNARVMSEEAIQYLCKCINLVNSLPTSVIDNLHLADNLTFSSTKIDSLLTILKKDCNKYTDSIIANLSRLELKVVTDESDMNEHNKLYLIKKAGETSYSQYVIVTNDTGVDEKILLGTCDISMTDYLKITDADSTYCKKTDFNSLVTEVDKVKTEIGNDTLTTTAQTLKGGINEVNTNKANASEVVKKTDIVTTIDLSSTNDTVPSAKTINTELDKINNNLGEKADVNKVAKKIYIKDVSSEDARTLIQNHWNEFDRFEFYNLHIDTAKWAWNAEIYAHTQEYGTVLLMSYGSDVPSVFYGKLYNNVWTWKELATVDNAKDVGVTTITPVNSAITGTIEYTVNKGICYVSLFNVKSTTNDNGLSISTTMPKPAINSSSAIVKREGSGNIGFVYINKNTTQLKANIYIADIIANCSFSYPVA